MWLNIILRKLNLSELASSLCPLWCMTYGVALGELQGSLCALLLALCCIVALLADRSGSIFAFLWITADSAPSPPSLPSGFIIISQISILLGKYLHWFYSVWLCRLVAALGVVPASRVAMDTSSLLTAFGPPLTFKTPAPKLITSNEFNMLWFNFILGLNFFPFVFRYGYEW